MATLLLDFKQTKNSKSGQSYLILQKDEWNRLKKQSVPQEQPIAKQKEYVKSLTEKSRAWTKTWPDHRHGVVASYKKKQRAQRDAIATAVNKKNQQNKCRLQHVSAEAIKNAREKIFEGSCFGNKLLSAYRESKTLEERDLQVQFLKQLKEKKVVESKKFKTGACCSFDLDKYATDEEKCRKFTRIQLARLNKEIYETQKKEAAKAKETKKKEELENIQFTKDVLVIEKKADEKEKLIQKEALQQIIADSKKVRKERALSEAEYQNKIIACQKQKEEMNNKINRVFREMQKVKDPWVNKVYENLALIQEEETRLINMKLENNIKLGEHRSNKREKKIKEKEKQDFKKNVMIAESNKIMAMCVNQINQNRNKLSDRQSLIVKGEKDREKKKDIDEEIREKSPHRLPVFGPCNKLMTALKKRMQQPPCWTGASASHQRFARLADDLLRDCKYKKPGRKVVDEYIKYNKLDSLDYPNYY